jgi:DNA-binding NtrC family response regulator
VVRVFKEYGWPGNIRELENMIKRIVIFGEGEDVLKNISTKRSAEDASSESERNSSLGLRAGKKSLTLKEVGKRAVEDAEKEIIQNVLQETHWNRKQAAQLLRVSYKGLLYKIQKYHLDDLKGYQRIEEKDI